MLSFEIRGLMDPVKSSPTMKDIRGKNFVFDGLCDPKSFFTYYTYTKEKPYHFYTKEYFDKYIKEEITD
tara:strand:- start:2836 stop:3042 length:207 start_codon:yes stop_codon:yes gene_type:complete